MRNLLPLCVLLASIALTGCAVPGSRIGQVGLSGRIEQKSEEGLKIRAALSKEYGLGGLDLAFGKPENYGRTDEIKETTVTAAGNFDLVFDPLVYYTGFWLLPPIGFYPKYPPDPVLKRLKGSDLHN